MHKLLEKNHMWFFSKFFVISNAREKSLQLEVPWKYLAKGISDSLLLCKFNGLVNLISLCSRWQMFAWNQKICNTGVYFTSMKSITRKSLWKAFKWLVLLSACTHLVLLFISFLQTQDITLINYFNIIDLDLFIPNIENGIVSQIFSLWIIILLYYILYWYYHDSNKHHK